MEEGRKERKKEQRKKGKEGKQKLAGNTEAVLRLPVWLSHTCCPAVPFHLQLVSGLGVSHTEPVVNGIGCLSMVLQVHTELVLPLGCDFAQVI